MRKEDALIICAFVIILFLLYLARSSGIFPNIIGFGSLNNIQVSIQEKISGKLMLTYQPSLILGNAQQIYTEFINTGTDPEMARIEVWVYGYSNSSLQQIAYYYDSSVLLQAGMRRGFYSTFVPPSPGLYYIQSRASYGSSISEVWGAFVVNFPTTITITVTGPPTSISSVGGGGGGGAIGPSPVLPAPSVSTPQLNLSYPDIVNISKGGSTSFVIKVTNVGNVALDNLKLYVSTSNFLGFTITPKLVSKIAPGGSSIFLVTLNSDSNSTEGSYAFGFQAITDETKLDGNMIVQIIPVPLSPEENIHQDILNYELMILDAEQEVLSAHLNGYDVHAANDTLNSAKAHLENAKSDFAIGDYVAARDQLDLTKADLQNVLLQLASITLYVSKPAAYPLSLILYVTIAVVILVGAIYYWKGRKKNKRPRLLGDLPGESSET